MIRKYSQDVSESSQVSSLETSTMFVQVRPSQLLHIGVH